MDCVSCLLRWLDNELLTGARRLHAAVRPELRYLPRILDGLCLLDLPRELCLASTVHPAIRLPDSHARPMLRGRRDAAMAGRSRPAR